MRSDGAGVLYLDGITVAAVTTRAAEADTQAEGLGALDGSVQGPGKATRAAAATDALRKQAEGETPQGFDVARVGQIDLAGAAAALAAAAERNADAAALAIHRP